MSSSTPKQIKSWKGRWGLISSLLSFMSIIGMTPLVLTAVRVLAPGVWQAQLNAGWWNVLTFVLVLATTCFVEWFVHRDILHTAVYSFFRDIYRRHGVHHGLTVIALTKTDGATAQVISRYAIEKDEQHESVSFPNHMLLSFFVLYSVLLIPVQLLLPGAPLLLGGYLAVGTSYACYEIFHPLEHQTDGWWRARSSNPIANALHWYLTKIEAFHRYHHLNPKYNMAIAGFLGFPLADIVLGTYRMPPEDLVDGATVQRRWYEETPQSSRFVAAHDVWAITRAKRLRSELHDDVIKRRKQVELGQRPLPE